MDTHEEAPATPPRVSPPSPPPPAVVTVTAAAAAPPPSLPTAVVVSLSPKKVEEAPPPVPAAPAPSAAASEQRDELAELEDFMDAISDAPYLRATRSNTGAAVNKEKDGAASSSSREQWLFADDLDSIKEQEFAEAGFLLSSGSSRGLPGLDFTPDAVSFTPGSTQDKRNSKPRSRFGNNSLSMFGFNDDQVTFCTAHFVFLLDLSLILCFSLMPTDR